MIMQVCSPVVEACMGCLGNILSIALLIHMFL